MQYYKYKDKNGRRQWLDNILGRGGAVKGNPKYEFIGVTRYWRHSKDSMEKLYREARIVQSEPGIVPREVR